LIVALNLLFICGVGSARAGTLTIDPTFDSSITSLSNAAAIENAINAAISAVTSNVASPNNITVSILFQNMSSGLGQSTTGLYGVSYYNYYNAFKTVATTPTQLTALNSLGAAPGVASGNPVNGTPFIWVTSAEGRNLGFSTPAGVPGGGGTYDSVIGLNTSITSPPNSGSSYYGLQSVANHEIDEALGIGGTGSTLGDPYPFTTGVGDLDLYRYSANGIRSYSTSAASSYFSIDGGKTVLTYFNQTSGADYADWLSNPIPSGFGPQVQDAFGEKGTNPALGSNELTAFAAIGYQLTGTTPEPAGVALFATGALLLAVFGWSHWRRAAGASVIA
jgi:hypothetical protein